MKYEAIRTTLSYQPITILFMRIIQILLLSFIFSGPLNAQQSVKIGQLIGHVGDSVTVCGKVEGGKFLPNSSDSLTLINLGKPYPNQLLTIVIHGAQRNLFSGTPESDWLGRTMCIKGRVSLFNDKPQIRIWSADQITFQD